MKIYKLIFYWFGLLAVLFLAACGSSDANSRQDRNVEDSVVQTVEAQNMVSTSVAQTVTSQNADSVQPVSQDIPATPIPQNDRSSNNSLTSEEKTYVKSIGEALISRQEAMDDLQDSLKTLTDNPSLLSNDAWKNETNKTITKIMLWDLLIIAYNKNDGEDIPARFKDSHRDLTKGAEYSIKSMGRLSDAFKEIDADKMREAVDFLNLSKPYYVKGLSAFTSLLPDDN